MTNHVTMNPNVNIADLKARLSEFIGRVENGGEVVVCRRNVPVVRLVKVGSKRKTKSLGDLQGWLDNDDFSTALNKRRNDAAERRRPPSFGI